MRITALYYWCTNQAIIQRALGAKSLKEGQKGVLLTALLKDSGSSIDISRTWNNSLLYLWK